MIRSTITDNSLCDHDFVENIRTADMVEYITALKESGVSYFEMTTESFLRLPPGYDPSHIIIRLTDEEDLLYVNSFGFGYILLPADMSGLAPQIERPIILEIYPHGSDPVSAIEIFFKNFDLRHVTMIRVCECFRSSEKLTAFIKEYKKRTILPLDFCALNNRLNAVSSVITALSLNVENVTMRFGSYEHYAEIQDYTLALASLFSFIPSPDIIAALCKASIFYKAIYGRDSRCVTMSKGGTAQLSTHAVSPEKIPADMPRRYMSYIMNMHALKKGYADLIYKKLREMQLSDEESKTVRDVVYMYCFRLFNND